MEAFLVTNLLIAVLVGPGVYKPVNIVQYYPWSTMTACQEWLAHPDPAISGIMNEQDKIIKVVSICQTKDEVLKGEKPAVFRGAKKEKLI
jgi:hypothetical protein